MFKLIVQNSEISFYLNFLLITYNSSKVIVKVINIELKSKQVLRLTS